MNYYTSLKILQDYRDSDAISQSFLRHVLSNSKQSKQSISMFIGSLVDCMLTSPHLTYDLFSVGIKKRPSVVIKQMIEEAWTENTDKSLNKIEDHKSNLLMKAKILDYRSTWKEESVWNAIIKEGEEYWEELNQSQGKIIVTREEWEKCKNITNLVIDSYITGKYFVSQDNVNKFYQVPLYWTIPEGIKCKGLLDILLFEQDIKTIYCIDVKTTSLTMSQWYSKSFKNNLPFQMAWYYEGIKTHYSNLIAEGWKIQMRWMVIPIEGIFKPWIIPVTKEMLAWGKYGGSAKKTTFQVNNKVIENMTEYSGWKQAIDKILYARKNQLIDYDCDHYRLKGKASRDMANREFFK